MPGKLFIGGIPRNVDVESLKEYFQTLGEVLEAVIMKDRITGRSRGFGFVVYDDPAVAERVVKQKHIINGRTVEARKAFPRYDFQTPNRKSGSGQGYPRFPSTKKIFVGGLASTVTESDFKKYFEQFGTTTDVVVMYDYNTNRSKGFGFISFASEEAIVRVLCKTSHELNGKQVEVKRAVPQEIRPRTIKSEQSGLNFGQSRVTNLRNSYTQGYSPIRVGGNGQNMDSRFTSVVVERNEYPPYNPSDDVVGQNVEPALKLHLEGSGHLVSSITPSRGLSSSQNGSFNRVVGPVGHGLGVGGIGSGLKSMSRNTWDERPNYAKDLTNFDGSGSLNTGMINALNNIGAKWDSSPIPAGQERGTVTAFSNDIANYGDAESRFQMREVCYARKAKGNTAQSHVAAYSFHDGSSDNFHRSGSVYGDTDRRSLSFDPEGPQTLGNNFRNAVSEVTKRNAVGYVGDNYNVTNRSNRV